MSGSEMEWRDRPGSGGGHLGQGVVDGRKDRLGIGHGHRRRQREQAVAGRQDAAVEQTLVEPVEADG